MKIFFNNQLVDAEEAKVSVFDHGLLYGDGVFEGIRLYENCIFKLDEHLERLELSAKALMLHIPLSRNELTQAIIETCKANALSDAYIRLVITRGVGNLGLSIKNCSQPQLFIIADKIQLYPKEYYEKGLKIITVPTRRNNSAALPPMIKSLNYLNNILAKIEAQNLGYEEAIMLNDQGYVAECTGDNIFLIRDGVVYTPKIAAGSLKGITRDTVIRIAEELNISIVETDITRYDTWIADEMFLTGTAAEIIPIVEVDSRPIGVGRPGAITAQFIKVFKSCVSKEGTKL
ncbi:MAG: branched-chain amino acid aminotransferase [Puniceicoccaceae bacterium]|nr:branched-chain amino acid aminotransferase [Puniceicoccaceae bacterium]|tara:strand:+ start:259 stop:1125 length:867 start_codon:yes stop_codon:yes gene_type:complete